MHNRTILFGRILLKHCHHFDYWNQLPNICVNVCYLNCREAGLCCYLVIHIGNLLRPLQLLYFHSWPVYWLFLIPITKLSVTVLYEIELIMWNCLSACCWTVLAWCVLRKRLDCTSTLSSVCMLHLFACGLL
jgi:hypothetical protein